ncbi:hypothetical protein N7539_008700 [Penicillium diatomitis]|uniref:Uncharacterized protein n=1 Tax=Penicillium diatomitis TaxID=2819901 RepID=A0A9X0BLU6_9EURO|nr:uncharacterized protein N7539_008700 [Penicillium diatomitis]KAJ5472131.1 hypothetical protein N7539_008700 [Penicillium diatomitis]
MPTLYEQCGDTALAFIGSFQGSVPEAIIAHRAKNCLHRIRSGSLSSGPMTNAEYCAWVKSLMPVMRTFQLHLQEGHLPIIDATQRKVTLYLRSTSDTDFGNYSNEYIWILSLDDTGRKVNDIMEFTDSEYTSNWIPKLMKAAVLKGTNMVSLGNYSRG